MIILSRECLNCFDFWILFDSLHCRELRLTLMSENKNSYEIWFKPTPIPKLPRTDLLHHSEFSSYTAAGNLKSCITEDLRICQEEDSPAAFYKIIPDIYLKFPAVTTGNSNILHLIVSCIDSQQLHTIICE